MGPVPLPADREREWVIAPPCDGGENYKYDNFGDYRNVETSNLYEFHDHI